MFEINDLLILCKQVPFVICDIILQDSLVTNLTLVVRTSSLEALYQLLLVLVKVLNQRLESLNLLLHIGPLLPGFTEFLVSHAQISLVLLDLIFEDGQLCPQIVYFNFLLVFLVLVLDGLGSTAVYLVVQGLHLASPFFDFSLHGVTVSLQSLNLTIGSD